MRTPIFFICVIIIALFGCKKKQPQVAYYPVPDALKKACLFQKGSYWVYRNDTTGIIDSTYPKGNPISGTVIDESQNIVYYLKTLLESKFLYQFYIAGKFVEGTPGSPFLVAIYGNYGFCCPGKPAFMSFNDTLTNHTGNESCKYGTISGAFYDVSQFMELGMFSTFKVNNIIFNQVHITRAISYHPDNIADTFDYYFSPGHGLVKIILRADTSFVNPNQVSRATVSWSLLRYKVVQ